MTFLESVSSPADLRALSPRRMRSVCQGGPRGPRRDGLAHRRSPGPQSGGRGAHIRTPPSVREPCGHDPPGRGTSVLRPQVRDRSSRSLPDAATARRAVRLPVAGGERARRHRELARLDLAVLGGWDREGPSAAWRGRPVGGRRDRRRGSDPEGSRGRRSTPSPRTIPGHRASSSSSSTTTDAPTRPPSAAWLRTSIRCVRRTATRSCCRGARSDCSSPGLPDARRTPPCGG